jgi:hypothetical protein
LKGLPISNLIIFRPGQKIQQGFEGQDFCFLLGENIAKKVKGKLRINYFIS